MIKFTSFICFLSLIISNILFCFFNMNLLSSFNINDDKVVERKKFNDNYDVKKYFSKKDTNKIEVKQYKGNVKVELDSYQQLDKLYHTNPTNLIDFSYDTVIMADQNNLLLNPYVNIFYMNKILNIFNETIDNYWNYNISSWEAKAGKRYMGNLIVVPMWAEEVKTYHKPKIYSSWSGETVKTFLNVLMDNFRNKIIPNLNLYYLFYLDNINNDVIKNIYSLLKVILNEKVIGDLDVEKQKIEIIQMIKKILIGIIDKIKGQFLKVDLNPNIISIDNKTENDLLELNYVDFGNVRVKYYDANRFSFKSDHLLPIIDYKHEWKCRGPTCSHNIRHLGDVIKTLVKDIILDNFGNLNSFFSRFITYFSIGVIDIILLLLGNINWFFPNSFFARLISDLFWKSLNTNALHNVFSYFNDNIGEITFSLFGKLEKHGIQLGKCGNLISGIKINSDDNIVNYNNNTKLVIYGNNNLYRKIFDQNGFNLNSIHCIVEMNNYKKLYNYIVKLKIDEKVKNILFNNIKKLSLSSSMIYDQLLNYQKFNITPKYFNNKLDSFKSFIDDGLIVPSFNKINEWDLLCNYVLPDFFNNEFYLVDQNKDEKKFFSHCDFFQVNNINTNYIHVFSKKEKYEIRRWYY